MTLDAPLALVPSFEFVELDVDNTVQTRVLNWTSEFINIQNLTPYPLYINWRTAAIPTSQNFETFCPAGSERTFAAVGNNFAFFLDISGNSIPAVGQKCIVTIQAGGTAPSSSQNNWRSGYTAAFTVTTTTPVDFTINAAGSSGISINVTKDIIENPSFFVTVETSPDGINFSIIKRYRLASGSTLFKQFPTTVNYFRIRIENEDTTLTRSGVFTYSLLTFYSAEPPRYNGLVVTKETASLTNNSDLAVSQVKTSGIITYIDASFRLPAGTVDYKVRLLLQSTSNFVYYLCFNTRGTGLFIPNHILIGTGYTIHTRLDEICIRIPVQEDTISNGLLVMRNLSGVTLNDVQIAIEMRAEI